MNYIMNVQVLRQLQLISYLAYLMCDLVGQSI